VESPPSLDLDTLRQLEDDLIYVFITGPGQGEGIAVALPQTGWILVDGCRADRRTGGGLPLEHILDRWRRGDSDPVHAMVLSHPHEDHIEGFAELLEVYTPEYVVLSADPDPVGEARQNRVAAKYACSWTEQVGSVSVLAALRAIKEWQQANAGHVLLSVSDGDSVPLAAGSTSVSVRAPTATGLQAAFGQGFKSSRANEASLVLELQYGKTVFVLGGDMIWKKKKNGAVLAHGWQDILARHAHLAQHHGLKVPHHGSAQALCPELIKPSANPRFWCVTPFNTHQLPGLDSQDGLELLLESEPTVHLTALSAQMRHQRASPPPATFSINELKERTEVVRTGNPLIDSATDLRPEFACEPLDAVWCCAMDDQGQSVGRWRGRAAIEVVRQ